MHMQEESNILKVKYELLKKYIAIAKSRYTISVYTFCF